MARSVFPARAGMIRKRSADRPPLSRIPRESGDDPGAGKSLLMILEYSPRERG